MTAVKTDRVCPTASPGQAMGHCVARSGSLYIDTSSAYGQQPGHPHSDRICWAEEIQHASAMGHSCWGRGVMYYCGCRLIRFVTAELVFKAFEHSLMHLLEYKPYSL